MAKLLVLFTNYLANRPANNTGTNFITVLLLLLLLLLLNHNVKFKEFLPCLIVHT
jgi:hypothetical protein